MTDTARVLLTAGLLSLSATATLAWRIRRLDRDDPARLVGELRLAQWMAVLLAGVAGIPMGLAVGAEGLPLAHLDLSAGIAVLIVAGVVLHREPRSALRVAAAGFLLHALLDLAHRPGWLSTSIAPFWYTIGSASYDVLMAALCVWATRR